MHLDILIVLNTCSNGSRRPSPASNSSSALKPSQPGVFVTKKTTLAKDKEREEARETCGEKESES